MTKVWSIGLMLREVRMDREGPVGDQVKDKKRSWARYGRDSRVSRFSSSSFLFVLIAVVFTLLMGFVGSMESKDRLTELTIDPSDPKLIKIEGTMEMCEELGIDPESVSHCVILPLPLDMTKGLKSRTWSFSAWLLI